MALKAVVQVGLRKQGRLVGWEGRYVSIMRERIDVPKDFAGEQLAIGVSIGEIMRAQSVGPALGSVELDTLEVTVDFEDEEREQPAA